jgi:hypothetical protein
LRLMTQSYLVTHLGSDAACISDVPLHLSHGVWHIEGTFPPLVHLHNVCGNLYVHVIVWLINHDMHQVKPASITSLSKAHALMIQAVTCSQLDVPLTRYFVSLWLRSGMKTQVCKGICSRLHA